jgi:peroxiredoxin
MAGRTKEKQDARAERVARQRSLVLRVALGLGVAVAVLAAIFVASSGGGGRSGQTAGGPGTAGKFKFAVGTPGPGAKAPQVHLQATDGSTFDLSRLRGKRVLLYFQEGVGCQPCWDQLRDIQAQMPKFRALGINEIVTITGDPLDTLRQKAADEGLNSPVLSDPGLRVSRTYTTNQYGMMGPSTDGHTFILVDPSGTIAWRADYGGAPDYTMYVPVNDLIADIRAGNSRS